MSATRKPSLDEISCVQKGKAIRPGVVRSRSSSPTANAAQASGDAAKIACEASINFEGSRMRSKGVFKTDG